jgi:hypothetical protein
LLLQYQPVLIFPKKYCYQMGLSSGTNWFWRHSSSKFFF